MTKDELEDLLRELVNDGMSIANCSEWGSDSSFERKEIESIISQILTKFDQLQTKKEC